MQQFILPEPLAILFSTLPQYPHSIVLARALNLTMADMLHSEALQPLHGKLLCLHVSDAQISLHFTLGKRGVIPVRAGKTPDLTIHAKTYDFIALAIRKEDPDTLFFSRRLLMEGDTELGLLLKNTLDALELPPFNWHMLRPKSVLNILKNKIFTSA
ncbi:MAG: ubiquinone anaerobic biosynthesis accessory factor UbiT [Gallionellaceae bacterium]|jgi:predicted lipid carrier protein YhbT